MAAEMINIMIAEDHILVRQALKEILEKEPDFHVLGESSDGLETLEKVKELNPDVLVLDIMIPKLNGIEVTRQVCRKFSNTKVVILSMYDDESYVIEALKNGALGYVLKCTDSTYLKQAIREAKAGRRFLSPPLVDAAIEAYAKRSEEVLDERIDRYKTLTDRERLIFQLVAEGNTSSQIAERLYISRRTVETHRANIMRKLGLKTVSELVRYGIEKGIVSSSLTTPKKDQE